MAEKKWSNGFKARKYKKVDENYKFYPKDFGYQFIHFWLAFGSLIYIGIWSIFSGFRIKNRKVLKKYKKNVMFVSNHSFMTDAIHLLVALLPRRTYFTMLESNLGFGVASYYFRHGGGIPIPNNLIAFKKFYKDTVNELKSGSRILFYPEGNIFSFSNRVHDFKKGAFKIAYKADSVIIPCCFTFKNSRGLRKLFRIHKPVVTLTFLEPYFIDKSLSESEAIEKATEDVRNIILKHQEANSNWIDKKK